jgi:hypothetical protein
VVETGLRYWYSTAKNSYNYYGDTTTAFLVSRLSYDGLPAHSGEGFFRLDGPLGFFLKGYLGGGLIVGGHAYDEDFPPFEVPYSKTISDTKGSLAYVDLDAGYSVGASPSAGQGARLGLFAGYHFWHEQVNAFGCTQVATDVICAPGPSPPLPTSVKVVTEDDKWNALRIGAAADIWFTRGLKLSTEAAYAHVWQRATDIHYFTFGPDPASGTGNGVHVEALLSYQLTNVFNVGIGGRWWHYNTAATDQFDQLLKYTTDRYGGFVQGSVKFGE